MKASEVKRLAQEHSLPELQEAIRLMSEDESEPIEVEGDDAGERLTNLLLAQNLRERIDGGEDPREAFRAVVAEVRQMQG